MSGNRINFDFYLTANVDVCSLSLLVVCYNPFVFGINYIQQCLTGLYKLSFLNLLSSGISVAWRNHDSI